MGASILAVWQNAAFLLVNPINSPIHLCHVLLIFFAHWSIFDIEGVHSGHRRQSSSAFSWFYFYAPIISNLLYGHSNASRVQPSHLTDHPQPYKHPAHHLSSLIFSRVREVDALPRSENPESVQKDRKSPSPQSQTEEVQPSLRRSKRQKSEEPRVA